MYFSHTVRVCGAYIFYFLLQKTKQINQHLFCLDSVCKRIEAVHLFMPDLFYSISFHCLILGAMYLFCNVLGIHIFCLSMYDFKIWFNPWIIIDSTSFILRGWADPIQECQSSPLSAIWAHIEEKMVRPSLHSPKSKSRMTTEWNFFSCTTHFHRHWATFTVWRDLFTVEYYSVLGVILV